MATFATSRVHDRSFSGVTSGFHNILYARCDYDSVLYAGDTVIRHPEFPGGYSDNCALVMYTTSGQFVDIVDLHTIPGSMIYETLLGVDEEDNLNIACTFSRRVFIQDTMINHCNTPYIDQPDIMLAHLDNKRRIDWVRTIGGTLSDQVHGLVVRENGEVYVLSAHTASSSPPSVIDFFQQDTVITSQGFTSISKLDADGILSWRINIVGSLSSPHLTYGKNGLLYFYGIARSGLIVGNDTLIGNGAPNQYIPFIVSLDDKGTILKKDFTYMPVTPSSLDINTEGDFYVSAYAYDTLVVGTDTIIVPPDRIWRFIGKFDTTYQPLWYYVVPTTSNQQIGLIGLEPDGDDLAFCSYSNGDVQIGDTLLEMTGNIEVFAGIFDSDGNLKEIIISNTSGDFKAAGLLRDKCGNFILPGALRGRIFLENDTAISYKNYVYDAVLIKILRNEPTPINVGPDTVACKEYLLEGPPGYEQYTLNDSLLIENSTLIKETGLYVYGCANDGCWLFDSIFIEIIPGIAFDLGNDTVISEHDTIILLVPTIYDSIRWFDGTDFFVKIVLAQDFPLGLNEIWAEVYSGLCSATDTLVLEIISDFGIEEPKEGGILIFPNPFNDELTIEATTPVIEIQVVDCQGILRYSNTFDHRTGKFRIKLENLESGIYMLHIITLEGGMMGSKIVKL